MYHGDSSLLHVGVIVGMTERLARSSAVTVQDAPGADNASIWVVSTRHFERWRAGDHDGLDELVRCMTPVLWQVVRSYGLEREHAEDVVQTVWLTLVRRQESIAEPKAVGAWLTTTARREAWRVAKMVARSSPVNDEVIEARAPHQVSVESDVVAADDAERLWRCVQALAPRCQRLLRLIAFDHRPDYAGLAADLGMPVGSIGPTRGRCLAKLKVLLAAQEGGTHV